MPRRLPALRGYTITRGWALRQIFLIFFKGCFHYAESRKRSNYQGVRSP